MHRVKGTFCLGLYVDFNEIYYLLRDDHLGREQFDVYEKWYNNHKANCNVNHTGSSHSMELAAAKLYRVDQ